MNTKLKYTLLIGGILALLLVPLGLQLFPATSDTAHLPEQAELVVHFVNSNNQFLSQELRVLDEPLLQAGLLEQLRETVDWLQEPTVSQHISLLDKAFISNVTWELLPDTQGQPEPPVNVIVDFDQSYRRLPAADQLLVRAGIVQTFLGLPRVEQVTLHVGGMILRDSWGQVVSPFLADTVLINPDMGAHTFARTTQWVSLYFVRDDLQGLYTELVWLDMEQDISLEETVLRTLLAQGLQADNRLFFTPDVSLIEISTIDQVAYIDLNDRFAHVPGFGPEAQRLSVYAIVNTLTGLGNGIEEVEFFIENERPTGVVGYVDLSQRFVRNAELVQQGG